MSWREHREKQEGDLAFSKTRMKFNHLLFLCVIIAIVNPYILRG